MNENEKISCNNDDHKSKNTNTKLLYKNESLPFPEDLTAWRPHLMMWGACLSTGRSTKWWSQKLHKKEYGHMVICMEIVQTHHLHRPKAHLRSLCCFKAFAKAEKSECYFNSSKVEAGQWVTGHRHHFSRKSKRRGSHA